MPMKHAMKHLINVGDDFHKLALIILAGSDAAFGDGTGMGSHHHYNMLYLRGYIPRKQGTSFKKMMKKWFGKKHNLPPTPNKQRWGTVGVAAKRYLDDLECVSVNPDHQDESAVPQFWDYCCDATKGQIRERY